MFVDSDLYSADVRLQNARLKLAGLNYAGTVQAINEHGSRMTKFRQGVLNVKAHVTTTLVALIVCSTISVCSNSASAQSRPNGSVAVVDVSYIFKNHNGFKQSMERMKDQVKAFEQTLKGKAEQLKTMREALEDFNAGSPEYKQREQDIARRQAQLQADTQLKQKEFLEAEARLYYKTYNLITKEIASFCAREGFSLVLRYNSEKINSEDRASVLQGVNRAVVYQRNLNITKAILARLNGASPRVSSKPVRRTTGK